MALRLRKAATRGAALAILLVALLASDARAQVVVFEGGEIVIAGHEEPAAAPAAAPGAPGAQPAGPPTARQQKLEKQEYDRRPSAILEAWSSPEPEPPELPVELRPPLGPPAPEALAPPPGSGDAPAEAAQIGPPAPEAPPAEEAQPDPALEAARKAHEARLLEHELALLRRRVTLGDWEAVRAWFAELSEDEARVGYQRLLQSLHQGPSKRPQVPQQGQPFVERNRFAPADVLGLASVCRGEPAPERLEDLGKILKQALDQGHRLEPFLDAYLPRAGEADAPLDRRELARVLVAAQRPLALEPLLPELDAAREEGDREGLNLVARHAVARFEEKGGTPALERAWRATQAVLEAGELDAKVKAEALERAVALAPQVRDELGDAWLAASFSERPERGREILAAIGAAAAKAIAAQPMAPQRRLELLELQASAASALLEAAPERAAQWREPLALLALAWLREAELSHQLDDSTSLGPKMQRDVYGNFFYWDPGQHMRGNQAQPVPVAKVLAARPSDAWLALLDDTLRPRFHAMAAELYLKVGEAERAFPHIELVAQRHVRQGQELADSFLRAWAARRDPNRDRTARNPYVFIWGFEERAAGIPLTRSKQERNLQELAGWVARLRALPIEVDDELLAAAFKAAHSTAEVYRLETIERIFGSLGALEPATLAELMHAMRGNLSGVWRDPAVQREKRTNRHQKDIQAEVLRGYELARATVEGALADHPQSWELVLARAALEHDENEYRHELEKDPQYAERRGAAFATFAGAAELYARAAADLEPDDESTQVHETWFYAALGSCDLRGVDHTKLLAAGEVPRVREALLALPGASAQRHLERFASTLFARVGSVGPAVKQRYLREGLAIAGDGDLTREARDLLDYYDDLVTEIRLVAEVDGSSRVGHSEPFGLRVDLVHTREIEREAGGFAKYLQNQNNQGFGWNYGRPTEDYRDKFEETAREALAEHFEVLSITFNDPKARSRAGAQYGWRATPYCYALLRPRGPQVDRVPPLRLDLDFLDTSGYVVLPVESAAVPIDASAPRGDARPWRDLALTQILDERQADQGRLLLEVKASAKGLPPDLDALLELPEQDFVLGSSEDHGPVVLQYDPEADAVAAERRWTLAFAAREGLEAPPRTFRFGAPRLEVASQERFRYVDADLQPVEPVVDLERRYGDARWTWPWWLLGAALLAGLLALAWRKLRRPAAPPPPRFELPEPLTPFSVIGFLQRIGREDGLAPDDHLRLEAEVAALERHYFGEPLAESPDLRRVAERWAQRAR